MSVQIIILLLSITALYFGAELALEAAEKIGHYFGMSPLVIGLLLIGFGTSLPEFFVSHLATMNGEPGMALGNIIGSNIANLFLIMGISGLLSSLHILRFEIKTQLIIHVLLTALLTIVLVFLDIGVLSGILLGTFFVGYLWFTFSNMLKERRLHKVGKDEDEKEEVHDLKVSTFIKLLSGLVLLYFGGEYLVSSGTILGGLLGISSYVISAIFVAFGTSFPELVTALVASYRKKNTDLITGNIIGSNIFNVAFVMGSLGFYKIPITENFKVEIIVLWGAALYLLTLSFCKKNFSKKSGILFLGIYLFMVVYWIR